MKTTKSINLLELFDIVIKKWWLILLLTMAGFATAYSITAIFVTPIYEAKTVLFIGQENSGLASIGISLGQLEADSQLITDYKQIALTHLVIDEVMKNTGMNIAYNEFQKDVVIETVKDSRLFTVGFRHTDPQIAKMVSDELAKQLTLAVSQIVGVENIRILDQATVPQKPIAPNKLLNAVIGGLLGLFASLFIVIIMFLLNDTVKDEEDIETLIGISVLGSIPKFKREAK
ncbi:YveK family protein [Acetobacterium sp.]|uniref:YveK family protein n=1 Tax=Acetobacterium sp. TaxID=1872094 RepID=UPI002F41965A